MKLPTEYKIGSFEITEVPPIMAFGVEAIKNTVRTTAEMALVMAFAPLFLLMSIAIFVFAPVAGLLSSVRGSDKRPV